MKKYIGRREFTKMTGAMALLTVSGGLVYASGNAKGPKMVKLEDPQVKGLGYMVKAKDTASVCSGCQFYTAEDGKTGKCTLLAGKGNVHAGGWCTAYVKKS